MRHNHLDDIRVRDDRDGLPRMRLVQPLDHIYCPGLRLAQRFATWKSDTARYYLNASPEPLLRKPGKFLSLPGAVADLSERFYQLQFKLGMALLDGVRRLDRSFKRTRIQRMNCLARQALTKGFCLRSPMVIQVYFRSPSSEFVRPCILVGTMADKQEFSHRSPFLPKMIA